ncbi:MAG: hypothetical protein ACYC1I_13135 [Acidimicrobiales bacterium]
MAWRDDRGDGPIEVVIAVLMLTAATLFGGTGLLGLINNSHTLQRISHADAALRNDVAMVTAQIQDQPNPMYSPCATPATYAPGGAAALTLDTSYTNYVSTITSVEYFNGSSYGTTCSAASPVPQPQLITVQVTYTPTGMTRSTSFAVVNPYVFPLLPNGANANQLIVLQQPSSTANCPSGYTGSGVTCTGSATQSQPATSNSSLSCPAGYTLVGSTCEYAAGLGAMTRDPQGLT